MKPSGKWGMPEWCNGDGTPGSKEGPNGGESGLIHGRQRSFLIKCEACTQTTQPKPRVPGYAGESYHMSKRALAATLLLASLICSPVRADSIQDLQTLVKQGQLSQALEKADQLLASKPRDAQQRAYQANAQSIKTQDQILQTLVNLR